MNDDERKVDMSSEIAITYLLEQMRKKKIMNYETYREIIKSRFSVYLPQMLRPSFMTNSNLPHNSSYGFPPIPQMSQVHIHSAYSLRLMPFP